MRSDRQSHPDGPSALSPLRELTAQAFSRASGAFRIGRAIGASIADRRVLEPIEARLTAVAGLVLCSLAVLFAVFPMALAYPLAALGAWGGLALLYHGYQLARCRRREERKQKQIGSPIKKPWSKY